MVSLAEGNGKELGAGGCWASHHPSLLLVCVHHLCLCTHPLSLFLALLMGWKMMSHGCLGSSPSNLSLQAEVLKESDWLSLDVVANGPERGAGSQNPSAVEDGDPWALSPRCCPYWVKRQTRSHEPQLLLPEASGKPLASGEVLAVTKAAAIRLVNLENSLAMAQGQDGTCGSAPLLARKQRTPWLSGGDVRGICLSLLAPSLGPSSQPSRAGDSWLCTLPPAPQAVAAPLGFLSLRVSHVFCLPWG